MRLTHKAFIAWFIVLILQVDFVQVVVWNNFWPSFLIHNEFYVAKAWKIN
jgi:hypothetical protein